MARRTERHQKTQGLRLGLMHEKASVEPAKPAPHRHAAAILADFLIQGPKRLIRHAEPVLRFD